MVMGNLPMIIMQKKSDSFTNKAQSPADVSKAGMRRIGLFHRAKQSVSPLETNSFRIGNKVSRVDKLFKMTDNEIYHNT